MLLLSPSDAWWAKLIDPICRLCFILIPNYPNMVLLLYCKALVFFSPFLGGRFTSGHPMDNFVYFLIIINPWQNSEIRDAPHSSGFTQLYISMSKKGCFFLPHLLVILVTHADIYGLIRFLNVLLYNKVKATCLFLSFCVFLWAPPRPSPGGSKDPRVPRISRFDPKWEVFCKREPFQFRFGASSL